MAMFGLPRPDLVIVNHQSFHQQHVCGIRGDLELDTFRIPDPQTIAASQRHPIEARFALKDEDIEAV